MKRPIPLDPRRVLVLVPNRRTEIDGIQEGEIPKEAIAWIKPEGLGMCSSSLQSQEHLNHEASYWIRSDRDR